MLDREVIENLLTVAESIHKLEINPGFRQTFNYGNLLIGLIPNGNVLNFKEKGDSSAIDRFMAAGKINPAGVDFLETLKDTLDSGERFDIIDSTPNGFIVVEFPEIQMHIDVIVNEAELIAQAVKEASLFVDPASIKYITSTNSTVDIQIKENRTGKLESDGTVVQDEELTELIRDLDFHISDQFEERTHAVNYHKDGLTTLIDNYEIVVTIS